MADVAAGSWSVFVCYGLCFSSTSVFMWLVQVQEKDIDGGKGTN